MVDYLYRQMHIQYIKQHKLSIHISSHACFCKCGNLQGEIDTKEFKQA
jgi:hypothetical protein